MKETAPKLNSIPADRFRLELLKLFKQAENSPRKFFDILDEVNALHKAYPEIAALKFVPAGPKKYHKEGSAYEHTMRVVESMFNQQGNNVDSLLGALFHDIGKASTPPSELPNHYGHDKMGAKMAPEIQRKYQFNKTRKYLIKTVSRIHMKLHDLDELNATTMIKYSNMIKSSPLSVDQFINIGIADANGKEPKSKFDDGKAKYHIQTAIDVINDIDGNQVIDSRGYNREDIGSEIPGERINNLLKQDRAEEYRRRI